ncbi:MAG: MFS transporter [Chitinophagaceae bacterium]|nr:MFS transporter [Chitinophagaceae bacterium]
MTTTVPFKKNISGARKATSAIFLICGIGISSWAPMVPYAKERLGLNDADLGLLLLLLGAGAITMMPVGGILCHRYGSRIVMFVSGMIIAITLPLLLIMQTVTGMGISLFIFGAGIGTIDIAMNAHGVQVQNFYGRSIMSSLHGLYSVGGLLGSLGLGFLIKSGLSPQVAAVSISILLVVIVCRSYRFLFNKAEEGMAGGELAIQEKTTRGAFIWLKPQVIFIGALCFAVFLAEGAMLDWSAVFLRENRNVEEAWTGSGYAAFSVAMAIVRLLGDSIVTKFNGRIVVFWGGLIAAAGFFLAVATPWVGSALAGFILLGIGAANIVPVFFSAAGKLSDIPPAIAIPVVTTMGYAGQLAGPAFLGFIAFRYSLPVALSFCGVLILIVAVAYAIKSPERGNKLPGTEVLT